MEQNPVNDLVLVAQTLFTEGVNEFTTNAGKVVKIQSAKMRHLAEITQFFNAVLQHVDQSALVSIVGSVIAKQKQAIALGEDPNGIDVKSLAQSVLLDNAPTDGDSDAEAGFAVKRGVGYTNLLVSLTTALLLELPRVVPAFTNLTREEFEDMDPDEASIVAGGIFVVNYRFFTQNLRPVLAVITANLARKYGKAAPKKDKWEPTGN